MFSAFVLPVKKDSWPRSGPVPGRPVNRYRISTLYPGCGPGVKLTRDRVCGKICRLARLRPGGRVHVANDAIAKHEMKWFPPGSFRRLPIPAEGDSPIFAAKDGSPKTKTFSAAKIGTVPRERLQTFLLPAGMAATESGLKRFERGRVLERQKRLRRAWRIGGSSDANVRKMGHRSVACPAEQVQGTIPGL